MMRFQSFCGLSAALAVVTACGQKPAATPSTGPTAHSRSDASASEQVSLTVYNQNFGLVREVRKVHLGTGNVELSYADVSAHIQPETVHLKSLGTDAGISVLEQNYRYDLLTPDTLLKKYVGKTIKIYRYNEQTGIDEEKRAEVLSVEGGAVLKIDGQITSNFVGRYAFPEVPENLVQKPTLVWLLASAAADQRVEVTYLTQGLDWHADYVLTVDAEDKLGDLNGWVTLKNDTGTSYESAQLKLVAGDVQRITPQAMRRPSARGDLSMLSSDSAFQEESLSEYHLYALDRPTSLLDKEQKQVSLLSASDIALTKKLIFSSAPEWFHADYAQGGLPSQKIGVYLDVPNKQQNHLGMPLPKGTVRVYKSDQNGQKQFIGEDSIDHTPRDEKLRIKLGAAFDVVGERTEKSWHALGTCAGESEWEIALRNHKDTPESVEVDESAGGDWQILSSSLPATKRNSTTFTFDVRLAPRSETKLTYRVRVRWC